MHCSVCGRTHPQESIEIMFRLPDEAAALLEQKQEERVQANEDLCTIDGERFFVRAVLPLPVVSRTRPYNIGVWVELDRTALERIGVLWNDPKQSSEPPFSVRIANEIPSVRGSCGTTAALHLTGPATRPNVLVLPTNVHLYEEQANGITVHRAGEYSEFASSSRQEFGSES